jgi:predicted transcriptional regulator
MTGHDFESDSGLQDWIKHELSHLAAQEQELAGTALGSRNLSLRVPLALHLMLARISEKLDRSKSAVAEEVLTCAIRDVYKQFDLPPVTQADLEEFAALLEKAPADKAAAKKTAR